MKALCGCPFGFSVAARRAHRLSGFGAAAALEIEDMLVRLRSRDNFNQFAGRRREFDEPSAATTLVAAVAQHLYLDEFLAFVDCSLPAECGADCPRAGVDIDMGRGHQYPPSKHYGTTLTEAC